MIDTDRKLILLQGLQLLTALVLFISPWLFGFDHVSKAAASAWVIAGVTLLAASVISLDEPYWSGWSSLAAGLCALLAPMALGFSASAAAFWSHVLAGGAVVLAAVGVLRLTSAPPGDRQGPITT